MADGTLLFDTSIDSDGFNADIGKLGSAAAKGIAAAVGVATAAVGAFGAYSVKSGAAFDTAMSQVAASMGVTVDQIPEISAMAKELGATTKFTSTQAAEGFNILAMAGQSVDDQLSTIGPVLDLASAGAMDMADAATYVTGALSGFSAPASEATHYANLFAKGATLANTSVAGLGEAVSGSAAAASKYGQTVDSSTLSLLRLAKANITGSEASTAYNRLMVDLYTASGDAKKQLDALGVSCYDQAGNARDLNDVVNELGAAMAGMTDKQRAAAENTIFSMYGMSAFDNMLKADVDTCNEWAEALAGADSEFDGLGSAAGQAQTQLDNLEGDVTLLSSAFDGLAQSIYAGAQGSLREFVQLGTDCITQIQEGFESGGVDGLMDALGSCLAQVVGRVAELAPTVVELAVGVLQALVEGIGANAGLLAQSAVSIVQTLAQGVSGLASYLFTAGLDLIGQLAQGAGSAIPQFLSTVLPQVLQFTSNLRANFGQFVDAGINLLLSIVDGIVASIPTLLETFPQIVINIAGLINDNAPKLLLAGAQIIIKLLAGIVQNVPNIIAALPSIIEAIVAVFQAFNWIDLGKNIIDLLGRGISGAVSFVSNAAQNIFNTVRDKIAELPSALLNLGSNAISSLASGVQMMAYDAASAGVSIFTVIRSAIAQLPGALLNLGSSAMSGLLGAIRAAIGAIGSAGASILNALVSSLLNMPSRLMQLAAQACTSFKNAFTQVQWSSIGGNIIRGIISGIGSSIGRLVSAAKNAAKKAFDAAKNALGIHSPSKKFAWIGEMSVAGWEKGWDDSYGEFLSDANDDMSAFVADAQSVIGGFNAGVGGSAATGRLAATGGGTVIVYQTNTVNTHDSYTPSEVTRKLEDLSDRMKWRL